MRVEARGLRASEDRIAERAWPATVPSNASLARCQQTLRRVDAESPADGARQWLNR